MLTDRIYYVDKVINAKIYEDFEVVENSGFYQLLQYKLDKTFWRLDNYDKYQERFLVKLESQNNWTNYNSKELQIELLLKTKGLSDKKCIWNYCDKLALKGLVYCERHAYEEMGIRK
jgi:hypothetical protein